MALGEMALARTGRTDQECVFALGDEPRGGEFEDEGAVDLLVEGEVEAVERAVGVAKPRPPVRSRGPTKKHSKRMATVAAVYTVAPVVRSPEEFLQSLMPRPPGAKTRVVRPRPVAKRVWASLEREPWEVVAEATLEAERQDPEQVKRWGRARRWGRDAARPRRNERRRLRRGRHRGTRHHRRGKPVDTCAD